MDSQAPDFRILLFPWLAHGHVFPFLELAKRILSRKNFHIHLCTTAINFTSIKNFIQANNFDQSIDLVELHLQPSQELPPEYHTTKNIPSHLIPTLRKAFQTAKSSYSDILTTLKPDLVIYDIFQPWAPKVAASQGIPAVHFTICGAATMAYSHHHLSCKNDDFPFPELCLQDYERESVHNLFRFLSTNVFGGDKEAFLVNVKQSCDVVMVKTSRAFEGKYVDYVSGVWNKKLLPVGPLVTDPSRVENSEILQWLSKKALHSTVYISFGSEHFLSKHEIDEIAKGLEICGVNFMWVIRFPLGENNSTIEESLPEGFLDRVQDRGRVVSGWLPQARILQHSSTCAFISHCGWSSIMESLYFGVPIIGIPIKQNMFIDANMLVEAGACVKVPRKDEDGGYKGEDIAKIINEVIMGKAGVGLRHRAQELSEKMRMEEGQAISDVAEHLWQLCLKKKVRD